MAVSQIKAGGHNKQIKVKIKSLWATRATCTLLVGYSISAPTESKIYSTPCFSQFLFLTQILFSFSRLYNFSHFYLAILTSLIKLPSLELNTFCKCFKLKTYKEGIWPWLEGF